MKTETTPTLSKSNPVTFTPFAETTANALELLNREEKRELQKQYKARFDAIGQMVLQGKNPNFTIQDFNKLSAAYDVPFDIVGKFYADWIKEQIDGKKIKSIPTIEDFPMYQKI